MDADSQRAHDRRWWTLAVLCLSLTVISIDNTILNVALPSIVESLDAKGSQLQLLIDGYTIVFACLLLTAGSLGDKLGPQGHPHRSVSPSSASSRPSPPSARRRTC